MPRLNAAIILLPLLLFSHCKMAETAEPATSRHFSINEVHDLTIGGDSASYLVFNVSYPSDDTATHVAVSVEGLPPGIDVDMDLAGGTLTKAYYYAVFTQTSVVAPGNYPVRIVGADASYTTSVPLNLAVRPLNGWSVDSKIYRRYQIERGELLGAYLLNVTTNDASATLSFMKSGVWPTADGSYYYRVGDINKTAGVVGIEFSDARQNNGATFTSNTSDTTTLTLLMHGGKASISLSPTEINDGNLFKSVAVSVDE